MEKKICPGCNGEYTVTKSGRLRSHKGDAGPVEPCTQQAPVSDPAPTVESMDDTTGTQCSEPRCTCGGDGGPGHELALIAYGDAPVDDKGPWFGATENDRCSVSECRIYEGDRIRADGQGGYECEDCADQDQPLVPGELAADAANAYGSMGGADLMDPAPVAEVRIPATRGPMPLPTADEFLDPAEPEVKLNVSGQPPARRDWQKRYIVVDPDLGDFRRTVKEKKPKGITRATTFNKAAQNTTHLNLWGKANVARGASLRPDILRRVHGLTWDDDKDELLRIVDELETAAGAKVAADEGTFLHEFCDQVDAGLKTWEDAPAAYQQDIKRYVEALAKEGLEPVPGLIERTVFIREYGGVAGTFDRIFYHRPSGQYIVGDLKTGKTMSYAMDETECQIFTYAHGVNQWGVYDWNTDTWQPLGTYGDRPDGSPWDWTAVPQVSEKVGVIIHMPVQGKEAGEVYLRYADLECGRSYAELNHAVRSYPKSKVRPFTMPPAEPPTAPVEPAVRNWHAEFKAVTSREQANALYAELKAFGANEEYLTLARFFGKEALTRLAAQSEDE